LPGNCNQDVCFCGIKKKDDDDDDVVVVDDENTMFPVLNIYIKPVMPTKQ
jgi:hypothetical protein